MQILYNFVEWVSHSRMSRICFPIHLYMYWETWYVSQYIFTIYNNIYHTHIHRLDNTYFHLNHQIMIVAGIIRTSSLSMNHIYCSYVIFICNHTWLPNIFQTCWRSFRTQWWCHSRDHKLYNSTTIHMRNIFWVCECCFFFNFAYKFGVKIDKKKYTFMVKTFLEPK